MKKLILTIATPSLAADVILAWDVLPAAIGYKIYYISTDLAQTWDTGTDIGDVISYTYTDVPDTGIIMFRVSAYNNNGEAIRYDAGVWYCGDCKPSIRPSGIGVQ